MTLTAASSHSGTSVAISSPSLPYPTTPNCATPGAEAQEPSSILHLRHQSSAIDTVHPHKVSLSDALTLPLATTTPVLVSDLATCFIHTRNSQNLTVQSLSEERLPIARLRKPFRPRPSVAKSPLYDGFQCHNLQNCCFPREQSWQPSFRRYRSFRNNWKGPRHLVRQGTRQSEHTPEST